MNLRRADDLSLVRRVALHPLFVNEIHLSADGERLVTSSRETVRIWDLTGGLVLITLSAGARIANVDVSPDGNTIVAHCKGEGVRAWSLSGKRGLHRQSGEEASR